MIRTEVEGVTAVVTIDREARRNALDTAHAADLAGAVADAAGTCRAVVVTGAGSAFCAGADFGEVATASFRSQLATLMTTVAAVPVPVVAAIGGPAIGAGLQLALACDLRVAGPTARFALPTARLGAAVDPWTVGRLTHLVGGARSRAILLGAETLDVDAAATAGLVDRLGSLDDARSWATEMGGFAPLTLAFYKRVLADPGDPGIGEALAAVWSSDDVTEGLEARRAGRAARFEGR